MECKANRSRDREEQSRRSDDQPRRHEPEVVRTEDSSEKRHDEPGSQRSGADRKAEYARREAGQHACIQLPSIGVRSSIDNGTTCLGEHVTTAVRGSTLVDVALRDVPSVVRAAVARIPRASVSELDDEGATITQRSGVLIPRVEVISLAFRQTPHGDSEVVIVRARRGGLSAPDPVLSEFEQSLLSSIRAAAKEASP